VTPNVKTRPVERKVSVSKASSKIDNQSIIGMCDGSPFKELIAKVSNKGLKYIPFKDARAFVHTLGLKSREEWKKYYKSGKTSVDIPLGPESAKVIFLSRKDSSSPFSKDATGVIVFTLIFKLESKDTC